MDEDDLKLLVSEQQRELMAAQDIMSDLDLAFRLQMEEAINASIALQPSTSSSAPKPTSIEPELTANDDLSHLTNLQTLELDKFQQERKDREQCEAEMNKLSDDLKRMIHDQNFAREILAFPEEEWLNHGDDFEKPFGEGSSSNPVTDEPFRLYFRGLVSEETVKGSKVTLSAIGAAICDPRDNMLLKVQKPLIGDWRSHRFVEVKALIEGLNAALSLNIKRIIFFIDYLPLFKQVTGRWNVKQRKMEILIKQVFALQKKFTSCHPVLLARNDVKFAIKLARDAIDSQITRSAESSQANNMKETCNICLEDTDVSQMFVVDGCLHRYCFSCMKQHVEVKLLHGIVPGCPHEGCKTQLNVDSCRKFLTPKFVEMMTQHIKEASVPVTEKVYCPYPKCSALMSKSEVISGNELLGTANRSGARKCIKCHGLFCINCKVPWHSGISCYEYKRLNPRGEEAKLKFLASEKLWRQCVKCNHMIELAEGCYHMTCRCGYEFCYTCGAQWKNKKATCTCPLWDEENILNDNDSDLDFEEEDYDDDDDDYEDWVTDDEFEQERGVFFL